MSKVFTGAGDAGRRRPSANGPAPARTGRDLNGGSWTSTMRAARRGWARLRRPDRAGRADPLDPVAGRCWPGCCSRCPGRALSTARPRCRWRSSRRRCWSAAGPTATCGRSSPLLLDLGEVAATAVLAVACPSPAWCSGSRCWPCGSARCTAATGRSRCSPSLLIGGIVASVPLWGLLPGRDRPASATAVLASIPLMLLTMAGGAAPGARAVHPRASPSSATPRWSGWATT